MLMSDFILVLIFNNGSLDNIEKNETERERSANFDVVSLNVACLFTYMCWCYICVLHGNITKLRHRSVFVLSRSRFPNENLIFEAFFRPISWIHITLS